MERIALDGREIHRLKENSLRTQSLLSETVRVSASFKRLLVHYAAKRPAVRQAVRSASH